MIETILRRRAPAAQARETRQLKRDLDRVRAELYFTREHLRHQLAVLAAIEQVGTIDRLSHKTGTALIFERDILDAGLPEKVSEDARRTLGFIK